MDDMGLGTKSRGLNAGDFSGSGSGGFGFNEFDLFSILDVPGCTPFFMTGLHGCKK
jgi:hypothetical protein